MRLGEVNRETSETFCRSRGAGRAGQSTASAGSAGSLGGPGGRSPRDSVWPGHWRRKACLYLWWRPLKFSGRSGRVPRRTGWIVLKPAECAAKGFGQAHCRTQ